MECYFLTVPHGVEFAGSELHRPVVRDFGHLNHDAGCRGGGAGDGGREEDHPVVHAADVKDALKRLRVEGAHFEKTLVVLEHGAHLREKLRHAPRRGEPARGAREELVAEGFAELSQKARRGCGREPELIGGIHEVLRVAEGLQKNEGVPVGTFL